MNKEFWDWYKGKGYEEKLSKDECFKNKAFLLGTCIEFLTDKGQRINNLNEYNNIDDMLNYLKLGVAWTS